MTRSFPSLAPLTEHVPSAAFGDAVRRCVQLGAGGDWAPEARPNDLAWAQRWLESAPAKREPPPFRGGQLDALLLFLEAPTLADRNGTVSAANDAQQSAITDALLASEPKPRQLEYAIRRLALPKWQRVASRLRDGVASGKYVRRIPEPWFLSGLEGPAPVQARLVEACAAWLLRKTSVADMVHAARLTLRLDEAPQLPSHALLGPSALHHALERATLKQWLASPVEALEKLVATLPPRSRAAFLNHALHALARGGDDGAPLESIDQLDGSRAREAVQSWLRGILRIYGSVEGWGVWQQGREPAAGWRDLDEAAQRMVRLLWLFDAVDEMLKVFGNASHRPERADFWRLLRPWIRDARVVPRSPPVCLIQLPGGVLIEFGESGYAAYCYRQEHDLDPIPLTKLRDDMLPTSVRAFQSHGALTLDTLQLHNIGKLDHRGLWQQSWSAETTFQRIAGADAVAKVREVHGRPRWWFR